MKGIQSQSKNDHLYVRINSDIKKKFLAKIDTLPIDAAGRKPTGTDFIMTKILEFLNEEKPQG